MTMTHVIFTYSKQNTAIFDEVMCVSSPRRRPFHQGNILQPPQNSISIIIPMDHKVNNVVYLGLYFLRFQLDHENQGMLADHEVTD